jgi:hypothetical protein
MDPRINAIIKSRLILIISSFRSFSRKILCIVRLI